MIFAKHNNIVSNKINLRPTKMEDGGFRANTNYMHSLNHLPYHLR